MPSQDTADSMWDKLGLKGDPFPLTPTFQSEMVWAGQPKLKSELDEILKQASTTDVTQFIGLTAPWGSGKTHALGFYSHPNNLPKRSTHSAINDVKVVAVTLPKSEKQIAEGFFMRVVDKLDWNRMVEKVREFDLANPDQFKTLISPLLQDNADLIRAFDYLSDTEITEQNLFVVQSYLFGQASKRDRDKLRFIRTGNTVEERYLALNAFLALESGWKSNDRTRLILWIDEAENLIKLSSSNFDPFTQGLRDILDVARKLYGCLSVIINFTPESKNFEGEMYAVLGSALYDRLDKKITISLMKREEIKTFIREALTGYKLAPAGNPQLFSADALDHIPTLLNDSATARAVNRLCSGILHAILSETDPLNKFPVTEEKIKSLFSSGTLSASLLPERPGL